MKRRLLRCLGVVITVAGTFIVIITLGVHLKYSSKMNDLLENRVIVSSDVSDDTLIDSDTNSLSETVESDIEDFAIESMEEDQKVAEIKEGTPVISIPSLDITVPVINGTDKNSLKLGAGKFEHSVEMGEKGNFAVAGHSSTIYNCIFNNLESIKLLDVIECYNSEGVLFKYYVINTFKTNPDNIGVTFSSEDTTMTIVTCTDNGTRRFIVSAKLMSDTELEDYKRNLKQILVDKAISIADDSSTIDVLSYFENVSSVTKIPYRVKYCNIEDTQAFFTNYILFKDKLKVNEHQLDTVFNQTIGFNFSSLLMEVSEK